MESRFAEVKGGPAEWRSPRRHLRTDPIIVRLHNKFLHDAFGTMSQSDMLESQLLISKLFRIGLEKVDNH